MKIIGKVDPILKAKLELVKSQMNEAYKLGAWYNYLCFVEVYKSLLDEL